MDGSVHASARLQPSGRAARGLGESGKQRTLRGGVTRRRRLAAGCRAGAGHTHCCCHRARLSRDSNAQNTGILIQVAHLQSLTAQWMFAPSNLQLNTQATMSYHDVVRTCIVPPLVFSRPHMEGSRKHSSLNGPSNQAYSHWISFGTTMYSKFTVVGVTATVTVSERKSTC